ncbi:MAG: carboxypeptidase regulatory-like domain-containing protein [Gammaproteobacteria bacterium]|nr:carboxypeptidase regulatory-like domain-containing protein [Gammaproteobacteria bacterium]
MRRQIVGRVSFNSLVLVAFIALAGCGGGGGSSSGTGSDTGGGGTGGGSSGGSGGGSSGSGSGTASYKIVATNDLGMHCVDADFSVFSILPPYNVVNAQVVRTDGSGNPALVNDANVVLRYSAVADGNGSVNSRSQDKTNFWRYVAQTYGANLAPGQGLKGLYMPAEAPGPAQTTFGWNASAGLFKAEGIPILPVDDAGRTNRYPLMRLTATDKTTGQTLATLDVVLPVSEETTCSDCHATGSVAAKASGITWSSAANLEVQSRENILLLHDSRMGTQLMASKPVLCAGCHYSTALDLAGTGPAGAQVGKPTMSAAMHAYHSNKMLNAAGTPYADRWVAQGGTPPAPATQSCYLCHPGKSTQCLRGAMTNAVTCQNCHGGMSAVGGAAALAAGGSIDGANDGKSRRPWVDLPRCQSCHTGDANSHVTLPDASLMATDGIRTLLAFDAADAAASPRKATNSRFAENANTLYRYSKGHGGVACEGCHNSTHAIWPNPVDTHNDNVAAQQVQGHAGTITECNACHGAGTIALGLNGPHGMHVVADSRWRSGGHGGVAKQNRQACAACHGATFRGSVLSSTAAQRNWGSRTVAKGTMVGCYDCHNGPNGD